MGKVIAEPVIVPKPPPIFHLPPPTLSNPGSTKRKNFKSTKQAHKTPFVMNTITALKITTRNLESLVEGSLADTGGLLRLAPCWVPRSFLQPGKRLKLDPRDLYAFGLNRGGIDERWFGSTTPAANDNRTPDEGLSYVVHGGQRFQLVDVVAELGGKIIGDAI